MVNHPIAATGSSTSPRVVNDAILRLEGIQCVLDIVKLTVEHLEAGIGKQMAGLLLDRAPGVHFPESQYMRSPGFSPSANPRSSIASHRWNMNGVPARETNSVWHGIPTTTTGFHVKIVDVELSEDRAKELVRELDAKGMPVARSHFTKSRDGDIVCEVLIGFHPESQTVSSLIILLQPQILEPRTCRGNSGILTCHAITVPHFNMEYSTQDMKDAFGIRVTNLMGIEESVVTNHLLGKERSNREGNQEGSIQYFSIVKSSMTKDESGALARVSHAEWPSCFVTMLDAVSLENFMTHGPKYLEEIGVTNATLVPASQPRAYTVFGTREVEMTPPVHFICCLRPNADGEDKLYVEGELTELVEELILTLGQLVPYTHESTGRPLTSNWANNLVQAVTWVATDTTQERIVLRFTMAENIDFERHMISDFDKRAPAIALRTGGALRWDSGKTSKLVKANSYVYVARASKRSRTIWREEQTVQPVAGPPVAGAQAVWNGGQSGAAALRAENQATRRYDTLMRSITALTHNSAQDSENNRRAMSQIRESNLAHTTSLATMHGAVLEGNRQTHGMQQQHTETLRRQEGVMSRLAVASSALGEVMAMQQQTSAPPSSFPSNGGNFVGSQAQAGSMQQVSNA